MCELNLNIYSIIFDILHAEFDAAWGEMSWKRIILWSNTSRETVTLHFDKLVFFPLNLNIGELA